MSAFKNRPQWIPLEEKLRDLAAMNAPVNVTVPGVPLWELQALQGKAEMLAALLEAVAPLLAAAPDGKLRLMQERAAYAQMQTTGEVVEIAFSDLDYLFVGAEQMARTADALRDLLGPTGGAE